MDKKNNMIFRFYQSLINKNEKKINDSNTSLEEKQNLENENNLYKKQIEELDVIFNKLDEINSLKDVIVIENNLQSAYLEKTVNDIIPTIKLDYDKEFDNYKKKSILYSTYENVKANKQLSENVSSIIQYINENQEKSKKNQVINSNKRLNLLKNLTLDFDQITFDCIETNNIIHYLFAVDLSKYNKENKDKKSLELEEKFKQIVKESQKIKFLREIIKEYEKIDANNKYLKIVKGYFNEKKEKIDLLVKNAEIEYALSGIQNKVEKYIFIEGLFNKKQTILSEIDNIIKNKNIYLLIQKIEELLKIKKSMIEIITIYPDLIKEKYGINIFKEEKNKINLEDLNLLEKNTAENNIKINDLEKIDNSVYDEKNSFIFDFNEEDKIQSQVDKLVENSNKKFTISNKDKIELYKYYSEMLEEFKLNDEINKKTSLKI